VRTVGTRGRGKGYNVRKKRMHTKDKKEGKKEKTRKKKEEKDYSSLSSPTYR
jgi:hypothetical protein